LPTSTSCTLDEGDGFWLVADFDVEGFVLEGLPPYWAKTGRTIERRNESASNQLISNNKIIYVVSFELVRSTPQECEGLLIIKLTSVIDS
jgi:hypothetical protein